jgi:hypothetical protein
MLKKILIAISFLSPLATMSATAYAGSTITDKSYWPSAARQSAIGAPHSALDSALAYDRPVSSLQPTLNAHSGESASDYRGGPHPR